MKLSEIKMGMEVRDAVTDTVGHITAICEHIAGYTQFVVQQRVKSDGTLPEAFCS